MGWFVRQLALENISAGAQLAQTLLTSAGALMPLLLVSFERPALLEFALVVRVFHQMTIHSFKAAMVSSTTATVTTEVIHHIIVSAMTRVTTVSPFNAPRAE
jgi:hypothetical protein